MLINPRGVRNVDCGAVEWTAVSKENDIRDLPLRYMLKQKGGPFCIGSKKIHGTPVFPKHTIATVEVYSPSLVPPVK